MQTIFGCSQGRSGIPALFPGFLLAHEKRKNNEEPVWLRLAKPWADGDAAPEPGGDWLQPNWSCSVHAWRGHRLAAASHLGPRRRTKAPRGEHSTANKAPAKHEAEGDLPLGTGMAPSPRSNACPQLARFLAHTGAPAWRCGDDDELVEQDFVKLGLPGEVSTEGGKLD